MKINKNHILNNEDISSEDFIPGLISIDTEFLGLNFDRDRLCVIQIFQYSTQNLKIIILSQKIEIEKFKNLRKLLSSKNFSKIMHFAYADVYQLAKTFKLSLKNIICTRTMSRIARTFSNSHSLKTLVKEVLGKNLNKSSGVTYWGNTLTYKQFDYASQDVLYLHQIYLYLQRILIKEKRCHIAKNMNKIIPLAVDCDLEKFSTIELLEHH